MGPVLNRPPAAPQPQPAPRLARRFRRLSMLFSAGVILASGYLMIMGAIFTFRLFVHHSGCL